MRSPVLGWALAYLLIWLILTDAKPGALGFGLVAIVLALLIRHRWHSPLARPYRHRWHPWRWLRFAGFFMLASFKGGLDTSRLAWRWHHQWRDGFVTYSCTLPSGRPQALFVQLVSLMPGTLSVAFNQARLTVHVLDTQRPVHEELAKCEQHIRQLFVKEAA